MRTYNLYDEDYKKFRCPMCRASYWTDGATDVCEHCDYNVVEGCYQDELELSAEDFEEFEEAA